MAAVNQQPPPPGPEPPHSDDHAAADLNSDLDLDADPGSETHAYLAGLDSDDEIYRSPSPAGDGVSFLPYENDTDNDTDNNNNNNNSNDYNTGDDQDEPPPPSDCIHAAATAAPSVPPREKLMILDLPVDILRLIIQEVGWLDCWSPIPVLTKFPLIIRPSRACLRMVAWLPF